MTLVLSSLPPSPLTFSLPPCFACSFTYSPSLPSFLTHSLVHYSLPFFHLNSYIDSYAPAPIDDSQDIINATATFDNGFTTMTFTRPLAASDPRDISLNQCRYFLFGWGGAATVETGDIMQHDITPIASTDPICLQLCGELLLCSLCP